MLKGLFRFIINVVVVSIGILATYLCWEYIGNDLPYYQDPSEEIATAVILFTTLILYYVNRPPKTAINKNILSTRLTQLTILIYHMLVEIDEQLIKSKILPESKLPITSDKNKHPIYSCNQLVYKLIESSPNDLSLERKDYTDLIKILQYKENPIKEKLYEIRTHSKEQNPKLLEKINNTLYQLEKINQKTTYSPQMLHKELIKLYITIQEVCDHINTNYPEYDQKQWK